MDIYRQFVIIALQEFENLKQLQTNYQFNDIILQIIQMLLRNLHSKYAVRGLYPWIRRYLKQKHWSEKYVNLWIFQKIWFGLLSLTQKIKEIDACAFE